jgi:hypothetical protein
MNCWLSGPASDDARVIGRQQAGWRPIGWFVADEVDVLHCECTAQQNQDDTVVELRLRIQQTAVLTTRESRASVGSKRRAILH